ncbi:hypothetical protein M9H77_05178 [Catharanthus roseus]|uniref:Uncharacterized protein n=1 Tax=Catharanthus roseus TaxID=4058 RepID=A0ACC0CGB0_CATRO|nr:hypothetical protein M9H77_05178 [Catharanthus roseus]
MENNNSDANHLDADVLLPPRKRLLAGLKRQNSDVNSSTPSTSNVGGIDFNTRMNNLLKSHLGNPNLSNEEIVEASRLTAIEAAKAARVARAVAEEKAAKAVKAVAAAKSALELVASIEESANRERYLKKNKMKKHVAVQTLYNKPKGSYSCRTDEELARKLHRAINSSPRISQNASASDSKRHKKLKGASYPEKAAAKQGATTLEGNQSLASNGDGVVADIVDHGCSLEEAYMDKVDLNIPKFNKSDGVRMNSEQVLKSNKSDQSNMEDEEGGIVVLDDEKDDEDDDDSSIGRKRGRMKQKKLPLSICSNRDQVSPKEDIIKSKNLPSTGGGSRSINATTSTSKSLFNVGPSGAGDSVIPVERTSSLWKCQSFKAPACVKQNKVMQS